MEKVLDFFRSFKRITGSTVAVVICVIPLVLLFVTLNLVIFVFDEQAGSVVSNDKQCAAIGKRMLKEGGSVVDAGIATMFCEGVVLPNRAGIGGGFTAILYLGGIVETITATPTVPAKFESGYLTGDKRNIEGAKAGGVPGELLGYWEMHRKYGLLSWKQLVQPTIELCEEGIPITEWLELDIQRTASFRYENEGMRELYRVMQENMDGQRFKFPKLVTTLRRIADEGPQVFYHGDIGKAFIEDITAAGGIMTMKDLNNYNVSWSSEPVRFYLPNRKRAYTTGLPSMGAIVALVINMIKSLPDKNSPLFWHRTIESMKHAFGLSYTLADIENEPSDKIKDTVLDTFYNMTNMDHAIEMRKKIKDNGVLKTFLDYGVKFKPVNLAGSSNICIISPSGNALVLTSSLMWDFGTFAWSPKTGIFLNTQIRSFTSKNVTANVPNSYAAYVRPGKRAVSPHAPVIIIDRQAARVLFVTGAAGSSLIPSQVITSIIHYCMLNNNAYLAANSGFFYPDALSNRVEIKDPIAHEDRLGENVFEFLKTLGHNVITSMPKNPYTIRTCIGHSHTKPDMQYTKHEQGGAISVEPSHGFNTFLVIVVVCQALWIISLMIYEIVKFEGIENKKKRLTNLNLGNATN